MKLYVFTNIIGNYCSGEYYFIAEDLPQVIVLADEYAAIHNNTIKGNENYTIEWDTENLVEHKLEEGFFPLNRMVILMEK